MSPLDFRLITDSTLGSVRILSMLNRNYHKPTICLCVSHVSDLKDEVKEKAIKLLSPDNNIIQDINVNGNDVTIMTTTPVGAVEFKAALGEESMQSAVDGSPLKVVIISKTFVFRLSMLDILNHISLQVHQTPYLPTCLVSNVLLKMSLNIRLELFRQLGFFFLFISYQDSTCLSHLIV